MSLKSPGLPYGVREPMRVHVGLWAMTGRSTSDVAGSVSKRREKCRETLTITPPSKVQHLDAPSCGSWSKCLRVVMVEGGDEAF